MDMSGKIRESATLKRIEKKRRAKQMRLARNIALGLTSIFSLASMRAEAATTVTAKDVTNLQTLPRTTPSQVYILQ